MSFSKHVDCPGVAFNYKANYINAMADLYRREIPASHRMPEGNDESILPIVLMEITTGRAIRYSLSDYDGTAVFEYIN